MNRIALAKRLLAVVVILACGGILFALSVVVGRGLVPSKPEEPPAPPSLTELVDQALDDGIRQLESGVRLTDADKGFLLRAARTVLEAELNGSGDVTRSHWKNVPPNITARKAKVFVTLYTAGRTRGCMSGSSGDLLDRVVTGTKRSVADRRFGGALRQSELPATRIDIAMLLDPEEVTVRSAKLLEQELELGIHAISLESGARRAFFKSSVPVAHGFNLETTLTRLAMKAGLGPDAWKKRTTRLFRYMTVHFAEHPVDGSPLSIHRYNVPVHQADVTEAACRRALRGCADYLVNHTDKDGVLTYVYDVLRDKRDDTVSSASVIRRLASTWILAELGAELSRKDCTEAAKRSIANILDTHFRRDPESDFGYLLVGDTANIATAAFAVMACAHIGDASFRPDERRLLLNFLFAMEDKERGCLFPAYLPDKVSLFKQKEVYYPGEALTAFMTVYERTKDPACLAVVERVFDYYTRLYEASKYKANMAAWMSKAYAAAFLATKKQPYADFVLRINDHLLAAQRRPGERYPDKIGSFYRSGGAYNTGVFTESLCEGVRVATALKDERRLRVYGDAIFLANRFLLQCQYRPENTFTAPNPAMALGGMRTSVYDTSIRVDAVQHAGCALLKTLRHVY